MIDTLPSERQQIYELARQCFLDELIARAEGEGSLPAYDAAEPQEAAIERIGAALRLEQPLLDPPFGREFDRALSRALALRPAFSRQAIYAALIPLNQIASGYLRWSDRSDSGRERSPSQQ
jgi:hypothetical protein